MAKQKKETKSKKAEGTVQNAGDLQKKIFDLKMKVATGELKDISQFKKTRKEIARIKTAEALAKKEGIKS